MASVFTSFVKAITPPPFYNEPAYNGTEFTWRILTFRPDVLRAELKYEPVLFVALAMYVGVYFWGQDANSSKAKSWFLAHLPILQAQFSKPTATPPLQSDGNSDFFVFSTGRKNIESLHTVFALKPRHDLIQYGFQLLYGIIDLRYNPLDVLELDFKLSANSTVPEFVFAVVAKSELPTVKQNRWDLTFTKTSESAAIDDSLVVMSEFSDVTENIIGPQTGLAQILKDATLLPYFRSLSVTDQPRLRPDIPLPFSAREKHVLVSLVVPPPSDSSATVELVSSVFGLIDHLAKVQLKPETKAKLKKTRDTFDLDLKKEAEKEKLEAAEEERKAAKLKLDQEKLAKMSPAEQLKRKDKEKRKLLKKSQIVRK